MMFDLRRQVQLKRARIALKEGRLDEAFEVAIRPSVREHRGGQALLEKLVEPLLKRARGHLGNGRLREALVDVERAVQAGGLQVEAAALREEIELAAEAKRRSREKVENLLESARAHLARGSLGPTRDRLDALAGDERGAATLGRHVRDREQKASAAWERTRGYLERDELDLALDAAAEAIALSREEEDVVRVVSELKQKAVAAVRKALEEGDVRTANDLNLRLRRVCGESVEARRFDESVEAIARAAENFHDGRHEEARVHLGRARKLLPGAAWIGEALDVLRAVSASLEDLRAGPLGELSERVRQADSGGASLFAGETLRADPPREPREPSPQFPADRGEASSSSRHLLWVDGVGTYLLLSSNPLTIGRAGSSAGPDLALNCNLSGYHAEIRRVEDDYFVQPAQGAVTVNGETGDRRLLRDGDKIELAARCSLRFRQPTAMTSTAVLKLRKGLRVEGDVRDVVLLDGVLLLGNRETCHVPLSRGGKPIVLRRTGGGYTCKADEEIEVDGRGVGREAELPLDAHVRIGEVSFTITATRRGRN